MTDECTHRGKFLGCKFEPRYDIEPPTPELLLRAWELNSGFLDSDDIAAIEALQKKVYVADVCIRCGKRSERASS